jgi:uncharacterized protein YukJ
MTLAYGYVKSKIRAVVGVKGSRHRSEVQYHLHLTLAVSGGDWDVAINVGTNDADDLLTYKLVYDIHHPITADLAAAKPGFADLSDTDALPALDFMRSDILSETGIWRMSDVIDGSNAVEPIASVTRLVTRAKDQGLDIYLFGRRYNTGDGIHDIHMNQGSTGSFLHRDGDDSNDHNDIWQDGGLLVDLGDGSWAAYFSAFERQLVPTDALGNPMSASRPIDR